MDGSASAGAAGSVAGPLVSLTSEELDEMWSTITPW